MLVFQPAMACTDELAVSPPKWHLAHVTWFFETFVLEPFVDGYKAFHPAYDYLFNSYYETHRQGETLHTENSYKYSIERFQALARRGGFASRAVWTDRGEYFSVHYLERLG